MSQIFSSFFLRGFVPPPPPPHQHTHTHTPTSSFFIPVPWKLEAQRVCVRRDRVQVQSRLREVIAFTAALPSALRLLAKTVMPISPPLPCWRFVVVRSTVTFHTPILGKWYREGGPSKRKTTFSFDALSSIKQITTVQQHSFTGSTEKRWTNSWRFPE